MAPEDRDDDDDEKTEPAAGATQSIEVQFSNTSMPRAKDEPAPDKSMSIDVQFSAPRLPRAKSKTVPGMLVESITNLPVVKEVVPKTRRGRLLVRSVIVGFALVATWIGVIVYWQLRGEKPPDFRPQAEQILIDLSEGRANKVYEESSSRFQEMVLEEAFVAEVESMGESIGTFKEIASVTKTQMFHGPSGTTARIEMLVDFVDEEEEGPEHDHRARASMSFLKEEGVWRMIGFDLVLPPEVAKSTPRQPKDAPPEIETLTLEILEKLKEGRARDVWNEAAKVFQASIELPDFERLEAKRRSDMTFRKVLNVTSAVVNPAQTSASFDALLEFARTDGALMTIAAKFKYSKIDGVWRLAFYKLILPLPHGGTSGE